MSFSNLHEKGWVIAVAVLNDNLFKLGFLRDIKQLGGSEGNKRIIKWVYRLNEVKPSDEDLSSIQSGVLIMISWSNIHKDTELILALIKEANQREAAGLIIYFDKYIENPSYEISELSDKLCFPIFSLRISAGNELKILKEICKTIIVDDLNEESEQNILESILNNENLDSDYIGDSLKSHGMNINNNNQIGIIEFVGFEEYIKEKYRKNNDKYGKIGLELDTVIKNVAAQLCPPRNIVTAVKNDNVFFLTSVIEDKDQIEKFLFRIDKEIREKLPGIKLSFGLGGAYNGITGINKSLREAKQMLILKQVEGMTGLTPSFPHFDVYLLLMSLKDRKILEKYLNNVLKPLVNYDKLNQTDLIDTLDAYLNENASTIEASDKLFIHKNTLKYRLKKIESLLEVNLHSLEDCLRLLLAVKIFKLFNLSSEQNSGEVN